MGGSIYDLVDDLQDAAAALVDAAGAAGLQPRVTSTVRTRSEQGRLYRGYLAGARGYPVAPPGFSAHEYGEAFDMVVSPMEALADVGYTWQQWGGGWNPADAVHFELPGATERAKTRGKEESEPVSLWDYVSTSLSFTSLASLLLELGYVAASEKEAEKIAKMLHIDPHGRIF